jgi:hypothetical protein
MDTFHYLDMKRKVWSIDQKKKYEQIRFVIADSVETTTT